MSTRRARQGLNFLADREKIQQFVKHNQANLQIWGAFLFVAVLVFWRFSDGDFSFILTLSSMLSMFSFLMVVASIYTEESCAGVSLCMNECFLLVSLARLASILKFEGYLPFDKSGDYVYKLVEIFICVFTGVVVYFCRVKYASTYDERADKQINHWAMVIGCLCLALLFHPSLNEFMPTDVAWAFGLYLESVASLPQLFMFRQSDSIQPFMTHFLAGQTIAKAFCFAFWIFSFSELNNPAVLLKQYVGHWVIIVQSFQLLLMGDFMYHYFRCISKGISVSNILRVVEEV